MARLSLKEVVQKFGGPAAKTFRDTGRLSVRHDLFNEIGVSRLQVSLRSRLEELLDVLWGVADLHAHPASNFGFGAESDGKGGIIWGVPGTDHKRRNVHADMPMCNSTHSYGTYEPRTFARKLLLSVLDSHKGPVLSGYPDYHDWPSALSPSHQQMHITMIHRAWRGGLRLMVASAVNNQLLHRLWHIPDIPYNDPNFDFLSAGIQLNEIQKIVKANSSWMQIVLTADEAYQAIKNNKLAVVLAVEMDQLTVGQILGLMNFHGVRLVTPIHLVDNNFGGAAIYNDMFDLLNRFLNNGQGFETVSDEFIEFHLWKDIHEEIEKLLDFINEFIPFSIELSVDASSGHKNRKGLKSDANIKTLMKAGLLIDVHHMSEKCIDELIPLAKKFNYPLLKTHTGLRPEPSSTNLADNENSVLPRHARDIMDIGGMIGLGVGHKDQKDLIGRWYNEYKELVQLTGGIPVGLGTDINGLDKHIDKSEVDITDKDYPMEIPCADHGIHQHPENLDSMRPTMPGCWNFKDKGLAHYGFIPEFLYAVNNLDNNGLYVHHLFSSAHAFVKTWKRVEEAQKRVK